MLIFDIEYDIWSITHYQQMVWAFCAKFSQKFSCKHQVTAASFFIGISFPENVQMQTLLHVLWMLKHENFQLKGDYISIYTTYKS